MKAALKRLLAFVPTPYWTRRYPHLNRLESCKKAVLCERLLKESGEMVFAGPFATMKLPARLALAADPRIIIGSYEEEIQPVINDVICQAPASIIDIGANLGYYAVGFALKIAQTKITAFEAVQEPYWEQLAELAKINEVSSKIIQRGLCSARDLAQACQPQSFILCDCEGAEEDILNPQIVPALRTCKILVELHEFYRPNVTGILVSRFKESHNIQIIEERERNPGRYRILKKLPVNWRAVALEEAKYAGDTAGQVTWLRFMVLTPQVAFRTK